MTLTALDLTALKLLEAFAQLGGKRCTDRTLTGQATVALT